MWGFKMKYISGILAVILLTTTIVANDDIYDATLVFERGLSVGVDAVEREYRVQGWQKEEVEMLDFMVLLDSKGCSTKRLLLLKDFGFRRGLAPIELSGGILLYKSFGNRPDAEELMKYLNGAELKEIAEKVYVYKKRPGEKFQKAPFAFKYIFDRMQKEIKEDVQVMVLTPEQAKKYNIVKEVPKQIEIISPITNDSAEIKPLKITADPVTPIVAMAPITVVASEDKLIHSVPVKGKTIVKKVAPKKTIINAPTIKAEIQTKMFSLKGGNVESFGYDSPIGWSDYFIGKKFLDKRFKVLRVVKNTGQEIKSSGVITTVNGVKYVKVVSKNLYFDVYNTTLED